MNGVSEPISIEYKMVHGFNQAVFKVFSYVLEQVSVVTLSKKSNLYYLCNCKSEISNVCNMVEGLRLQAMKIVHYYANSCFDW